MAIVSNPFVDYLSRYTTASPDHEAAFDEFLAQAPTPAGGPLRLSTRVDIFTVHQAAYEALVYACGTLGSSDTTVTLYYCAHGGFESD